MTDSMSEFSNNLEEHRKISRDSDETLSYISEYIESHPENSTELVTITVDGEPGDIQLKTSNGLLLNNVLPEGIRIVQSVFDDFAKSETMVHIPKNIERLGLFGKIAFAHECGHIFSPEDNNNVKVEQLAGIEFNIATSDEERLVALLKNQVSVMSSEIQAWHYGKSVADLLKVDEVYYEDLMNYAIEHYFLNLLEGIACSIDINQMSRSEVITIIEPKLMDPVDMTVGELADLIGSHYKSGKILSRDKVVLKKRETYSKK